MKLFNPLHQSSFVIHNWTPRSCRTLAYLRKISDGKIFRAGEPWKRSQMGRYLKEPWSHKRKPWEMLAGMMRWRTRVIWEVNSFFYDRWKQVNLCFILIFQQRHIFLNILLDPCRIWKGGSDNGCVNPVPIHSLAKFKVDDEFKLTMNELWKGTHCNQCTTKINRAEVSLWWI